MDIKLQRKLRRRFPKLLPKVSKNHPCLALGIECKDGWFSLLQILFLQLEEIRKTTGITTEFLQIKEKSGSLRAYYQIKVKSPKTSPLWGRIIRTIVTDTTNRSQEICEVTGQPKHLPPPPKIPKSWEE
jgi:hypothetical protein